MWTTLGIVLLCLPLFVVLLLIAYVYVVVVLQRNYVDFVGRIFVEKPLFVIPRGENDGAAEDVRFPTADGMQLLGAYFKTPAATRKGVILFGIEYGSDRWSCRSYCDPLLAAGYDIFAYEPRGQGKSDAIPNYEPVDRG